MKQIKQTDLTSILKSPKIGLKRGNKLTKVVEVFRSGFYKAYKIDAFKEPPRDILPRYIQVFCRKMAAAFGVEVICVEDVPATHGLWACNHISWMDIPVVGSASPVFFLSKSEVADYPLIGKLAKAAGTLFIRRGSGDAGTVSEQIAKFLQQGDSVVFFPEATTTNGHKIKNIHGKLLQAAMQTGLPIQPMVICYVGADGHIDSDVPYCDNITLKDSLLKVLDSGKTRCYVLPLDAIYPQNLSQEELTDILYQRMQVGLARLQQQVLSSKPSGASW